MKHPHSGINWALGFNNQIQATKRLSVNVIGLIFVLAVGLSIPEISKAQVIVHLPQYSEFRVNSSFFVPDGGSLYQGGVGRSSMGYNSAGVPLLGNIPGLGRFGRNQGIGYSTSSSGVITTAKVYNMREIGDGILNGTHDSYGNRTSGVPYRDLPGSAYKNIPFDGVEDSYRSSNAILGQANSAFMGQTPSTSARSQPPQLSPEQIKRRAQFLKSNLGRNR